MRFNDIHRDPVKTYLSEQYNSEQTTLLEMPFRLGSRAWFETITEARTQWQNHAISLNEQDIELVQTDIGQWGLYEGEQVPLDLPIQEPEILDEAEYQGKKVTLNKPKRGGSKKFYVFVRNPKSGNIKKVSFGDTTGLSVKIQDPEARKSFVARHQCDKKTDKTKASYWSCRLPRYAKALGLSPSGAKYW
jgi:hypothetical protein